MCTGANTSLLASFIPLSIYEIYEGQEQFVSWVQLHSFIKTKTNKTNIQKKKMKERNNVLRNKPSQTVSP